MSQFVSRIIREGKPFTDYDFPASLQSLLDTENDNGGLDSKTKAFFESLVWRRLSEVYAQAESSMDVFKKGIEPSDVCQGKIADCYFLSCISALAETPGRVESLFNTKTVNSAGIYSINFYVNGKREEVVIDDQIPCHPENQLPVFAYSCDQGEIWCMLIEKAWAKLHGSYCMIRKGSCISALPHLTGAASEQFNHNTIEDLDAYWRRLEDAVTRKYVVTASTYETDLASAGTRRQGIISGHSYCVIQTSSFKHQGERVKLLKLRNPQGQIEWEGDWSDNSDKWTNKLREKHGATRIADDGVFFIPFDAFVEHFRCTSINYETSEDRQSAVKTSSVEYDFSEQEGDDQPFQMAAFNMSLPKDVDLTADVLSISINQQGERLKMYRNTTDDRFEPARFNIMLIHQPQKAPAKLIQCENSTWMQGSLILGPQDDFTVLPRGLYTIIVLAVWNQIALDNSDYQRILMTVHAPCTTQIQTQGAAIALRTLQKLFISDSLMQIKAGQAASYDGEFAGKAFRVVKANPYPDMLMGYIYTQNSNESSHPLCEVVNYAGCKGATFIRSEEDEESADDKTIRLDLDPGTSDLIMFVHTEARVELQVRSRMVIRKITREELLQKTIAEGDSKPVPDTSCRIKMYKSAHSHGVLISNEEGPDEQTIDIYLKFAMVNYRIEGQDPGVSEVRKVIRPGQQEFIMIEKIDDDKDGSIRTSYRYALGLQLEGEDQIVAKMVEQAKSKQPQQLVFKGNLTEVYLHQLVTKDSIWYMWENKTQQGPHAPSREAHDTVKTALERKHTHRDRQNETTFSAKYTFQVSGMELVNPDAGSRGTQWSFQLATGDRIFRQIRKLDHEQPGVEYRCKVSAQYKFVPSTEQK